MSKSKRARYTLELKIEAVRLVRSGQSITGVRFPTRRVAMDEVIDWMSFYNHRRLHSTLAYVSPMQFEQRWLDDQEMRPHDGLGYGIRKTGARSASEHFILADHWTLRFWGEGRFPSISVAAPIRCPASVSQAAASMCVIP